MSEWQEVELGEITDWFSGGTPKKSVEGFWNGSIPWISAKTLTGTTTFDSELNISQVGLESGSRLAQVDDILLLVRGSGLYNDIPISIVTSPVAFNQDIKALRVNSNTDIEPEFLLYWLIANKRLLNSILESTGIGAGKFDTDILKSLKVSIPPNEERTEINKTARSIYAKIDLLRRQNHTLEQIAQTLFKRWFVEFEFPTIVNSEERITNNEKRKMKNEKLFTNHYSLFTGYKSSGGPMVASELGEIPEGWRVGSFLDIFDLLSGGTPKTSISEYWDGEIKWLSGKDVTANHRKFILNTEKQITEEGLNNSATKLLPKFTVVISARGTVGCYCLLSEPMCMSQTNYGIKAKSEDINFFTYLSVSDIVEKLKSQAYGSVFDTITTNTFRQAEIVIPPQVVQSQFETLVTPIFCKILANDNQAQTLTRLRDTLLPKLMSGQIRVKNE